MSRELLKRAAVVLREVWDNDDCYCAPSVIKLQKEIVAYLAQPEPEPEPVAWMVSHPSWPTVFTQETHTNWTKKHTVVPLYTTPPDQSARIGVLIAEKVVLEQQLAALQAKRERLSDSKIIEIMGDRFPAETIAFYEGFRAAEKAHGLGINHE